MAVSTMSENKELTPRRAFELYNEEGLSNSQIGERYDCSESTVSRRRKTYREMKDTASEVAAEQIQEYDFSDHIEDSKPDNNPFAETECPACGSMIPMPDTAGEHTCGKCEATLRFTEEEVNSN